MFDIQYYASMGLIWAWNYDTLQKNRSILFEASQNNAASFEVKFSSCFCYQNYWILLDQKPTQARHVLSKTEKLEVDLYNNLPSLKVVSLCLYKLRQFEILQKLQTFLVIM